MICMSFNVHGIWGAPKLLSLKNIVKSSSPDIHLLQEMMCVGSKVVEGLSPWLKEWSFCALEFNGFSGDLLITWSPNLIIIST